MAQCSKVAEHIELLAQCEALRAELLQQVSELFLPPYYKVSLLG